MTDAITACTSIYRRPPYPGCCRTRFTVQHDHQLSSRSGRPPLLVASEGDLTGVRDARRERKMAPIEPVSTFDVPRS